MYQPVRCSRLVALALAIFATAVVFALVVPASNAFAGSAAPKASATNLMATAVGRPEVCSGGDSGYAIKPDGSLWVWGNDGLGELGLGDLVNRSRPTRLGRTVSWVSVATNWNYCLALKSDGSLWAWGLNVNGELGIGVESKHSDRPRRVAGSDWRAVACDLFSVAIKRDGSLWAWGINDVGELGNTTVASSPVPVRIGTDDDWKAIAVGGFGNGLALKTNGTLWAWGGNEWGELGQGTSDDLSHPVPTQIGTDSDWVSIAAGEYSCFAIKSDGSLWAWGENRGGQLGTGDRTNRFVPTRVGTGTGWVAVAPGWYHCLALKRDGSLWAWGSNTYGELGIGRRGALTPTLVGYGWAKIADGNDFSLAVKTNGTFWAWGSESSGQLGLGPINGARIVPTRIRTLG
jgi:alpha-tubulin suppressor-like RCC1 family protein